MTYSLDNKTIYALADLIDISEFPLLSYIPSPTLPDIFDGLYFTDAQVYTLPDGLHINIRLAFEQELALFPPGLSVISLVAGAVGNDWTSLHIQLLIGSEPFAQISDIPLVLRIDKSILKPMISVDEVDTAKIGVEIPLGSLSLKADSTGFTPELDIVANLPLSMILDTGLLVQASDVHVVFCKPIAPIEGLDPSFRGVYIKEATIFLPKSWGLDSSQPSNARIVGTNLTIGANSDFSGELMLDTSQSSILHTQLPGGIKLGLELFSITFVHKNVTHSQIRGKLSIPGLKSNNGQDDAEFITLITLNNGQYNFSATSQNGLRIGNLDVDISLCSLTYQNAAINDVAINGTLTLPGMQDVNNQPAKAGVTLAIIQNDYKFGIVSSLPSLKIGDFALALNQLELAFNKTGLTALNAQATLTLPWFSTSTTPCNLDVGISYDSAIYKIACASAQADVSIGGFGISVRTLDGSFDANHVISMAVTGTLSIPFAYSNEAGTTSVTLSYNVSYVNSICTLTASTNGNFVYIGGFKAYIDSLSMTFDNSGLTSLDLRGRIDIPALSSQSGKTIDFTITKSGSSYAIALNATGLDFLVGPFTLSLESLSGTFVNNLPSGLSLHGSISHPDLKNKNTPSLPGKIAVALAKSGTQYTVSLSSSDALVLANCEAVFSAFTMVFNDTGVQSLLAQGSLAIPGIQTTATPCEFTLQKSPADKYLVSLKNPLQNISLEIFILSIDTLSAEFTPAALTGFSVGGKLEQESFKDATNDSQNAVFTYSMSYTASNFAFTLSSTPFSVYGFKGSLGSSSIVLQNGVVSNCQLAGTLQLPSIESTPGTPAAIGFLFSKSGQDYHFAINHMTGLMLGDLALSIDAADVLVSGSTLSSIALAGDCSHPAFKDPANATGLQNIHYHLSYINNTFAIGFTGDITCVFGSLTTHLTQLDASFDATGLLSFIAKGALVFDGLKTAAGTPSHVNFDFEKNGSSYVIGLVGAVDVVLDPFTLTLSELSGSFTGADVTGFTIKGLLQHPEFKDIANPTQPGKLAFTIAKNSSTYGLTLGGCSFTIADCTVTLVQLLLELDNSGIKTFTLNGSVNVPMLQVTSTAGTSTPANFALAATKDVNTYTFTLATNATALLNLEVLSLRLKMFSISFDKSGLTGVLLGGELYISGLHNDTSPGKGIAFSGGYINSIFSLSVTSGTTPAAIDLGGVIIEFNSLSFSFSKQGLQSLGFATTLKFPGFENPDGSSPASCTLTFVRNADKSIYAKATGDVLLNLGSIKITLTKVAFTIDANGNFSPELGGELAIDAFTDNNGEVIPIAISVDITNGFDVTASVLSPLKVLDIKDYIDLELSNIGLGRVNNVWKFGFAGTLHNYIKIPVVEKYLPKAIIVEKFLIEGDTVTILKFSIEWDSALKVQGDIATGVNVFIPVDASIAGVAYLEAIQVAAKAANPGLKVNVALVGARLSIGPFTAVVEGLGVSATFTPANNGSGTFGPFNIAMGVIPPKGIGISLQTSTITAGGYLFFDSENERYAGAVEISIKEKFGLTAIGILTTKLPDGSKGVSLLLIIGIRFPVPIPLGYNFFIAGVGGLVGLNRTMNVDNMIQGVRTGAIENVLFPTDVIKNIVKIIADLESFFPPRKGQFLIGGIAMITWSTPPIVTVEFGLIIEFADPVRIAILGIARVVLPSKEDALIYLQVTFLGVIDFGAGMLTFDASLVDSKILTFTIEGDMAVRLSWGENKDFLLSIGGFHPMYTVPNYLRIPKMRRMAFNFMTGNPRCVLTAYLAVTTNTVQFGASIDFSYSVSKFKAVAFFSMDVLFQFSPFYFIATINCGAAIKWGDTTLMGITLKGSLSGPRPWHVRGSAEFEVLFFSYSVSVDETFGDSTPVTLPDIDVLPGLLDALNKDTAWKIEEPKEKIQLVTIRQGAPDSEAKVQFLAPTGALTITQNYAPLGLVLQRFGNALPHDIQSFTIKNVTIGTDTETGEIIKDRFAPAQYLALSDNEKLRAPSFELMTAGIKVGATNGLSVSFAKDCSVQYELVIEDEEYNPDGSSQTNRQTSIHTATNDQIAPYISGGDIGKNRSSQIIKNRKKYQKLTVAIKEEMYIVVDKKTLQPYQSSNGVSYSQAVLALTGIDASKYIIVPYYQAAV